MRLVCESCGEVKEVDSARVINDMPLQDWWDACHHLCRGCREGSGRALSLSEVVGRLEATVVDEWTL